MTYILSILESLGVLYDPSLLPNIGVVDYNIDPTLALGSCSMRNVTRFLKRQDSGIPRAVVYLIEFQGTHTYDASSNVAVKVSL